MAAIDAATQRAEAAASRAEKSAEIADRAASQAFDASVRALEIAYEADHSKQRAENAVSRMEFFCAQSVPGYGIPPHGHHHRQIKPVHFSKRRHSAPNGAIAREFRRTRALSPLML
jgi:hypothetical protein